MDAPRSVISHPQSQSVRLPPPIPILIFKLYSANNLYIKLVSRFEVLRPNKKTIEPYISWNQFFRSYYHQYLGCRDLFSYVALRLHHPKSSTSFM
jgi:hypothetical protein